MAATHEDIWIATFCLQEDGQITRLIASQPHEHTDHILNTSFKDIAPLGILLSLKYISMICTKYIQNYMIIN
ncbi:hypothetical protein AOE01nite_08800 [Acetobacter oeni]|uniref:Uncharacterized protein n=1 Tax=Acetobacter oeni TaxID=304077 RepID=A0A511XI86_9PROT|nr:hypothetical protein AA21952_3369 [Acetobacter oeni LMG 21952]GEN62656.1 hypothetical protein AOE01nite_08800 [Acetobacter oeni]